MVIQKNRQQDNNRKYFSSIHCIAIAADSLGVSVSLEELYTTHKIDREPHPKELLKIANGLGFSSAEYIQIKPNQLKEFEVVTPLVAKLKDSRWVIISHLREYSDHSLEPKGVGKNKNVTEVMFFNPTFPNEGMQRESIASFSEKWSGWILPFKRPFGITWFLKDLKKHKGAFFHIFLAAIFITIIALVTPIFFQLVIDKVLANHTASTLQSLGAGIILALILDSIISYTQSYILLHTTMRIDCSVSVKIFQHLLSLPIQFFEKNQTGILAKHIEQGTRIREFLTETLFFTLLQAMTLVVFLPLLYCYNHLLFWIVISFTGAIALTLLSLIGTYRKKLKQLYNAQAQRQAMLIETLQGIETVKSLAMEPSHSRQWQNKVKNETLLQYNVGLISISVSSLSQWLEKVMAIAILWFGASAVFNGSMTVGELVAFQMLSSRVSGPLVQLASLLHSRQETMLSVKMLGSIMNASPEAALKKKGTILPLTNGMNIRFENISFAYNTNKTPVLHDFNFYVPKGKVIGIVGESGSGKSTILKLIQGFHRPQAGLLSIDEIDIKKQNIEYLRKNTGVVLQETFIFKGTVLENIAMSKPTASFPEIVKAARVSGAAEFIERLPKSFHTELEEGGKNLSGGQKQRLAIARALLTNPKLLILDEATSALDPVSEQIIQNNLSYIVKDRTVIIVSHRLSMLKMADGILVISKGKPVDYHCHQVLLDRCSIYRNMWELQMTPEVS